MLSKGGEDYGSEPYAVEDGNRYGSDKKADKGILEQEGRRHEEREGEDEQGIVHIGIMWKSPVSLNM